MAVAPDLVLEQHETRVACHNKIKAYGNVGYSPESQPHLGIARPLPQRQALDELWLWDKQHLHISAHLALVLLLPTCNPQLRTGMVTVL